jgi:hypothetical protein
MPRYRGDDVPPISAYAHWGEEAEQVWWLENKYDMQNAGEPLDDPNEEDWEDEEEDDPDDDDDPDLDDDELSFRDAEEPGHDEPDEATVVDIFSRSRDHHPSHHDGD